MTSQKHIPTVGPGVMDEFHFGKIQWDFLAQHNLFHINRIEDFLDKLSFPLPPHRKTIYDLIFLRNGKSKRSKGLNQYEIKKNQIFFLPALQMTSHESISEDAEGFYLHFSKDIFTDSPHLLKTFSFLRFLAHPIVAIPDDRLRPILNIFYRLEELYQTLTKEDLDLIRWYLLALLTEVNRFVVEDSTTPKKNAAAQLTQQYKDALTQHIYQKQTVQDFAGLLFVTPNHLNKCVKKTLGKTAQSLLNEMLILEAKSLLKYSGWSISQIAENLCARTPSNFTRFFKSQTGISPRQYLEL